MKLNSLQLSKQLTQALPAVISISGDEPLLCQEALDAVRQAAKSQGYSEREVLHVDAQFDWNVLYHAGASLSLFAQKRVLELRIASSKLGDKGAAALLEYLARPAEDTLLLISLPKLDGSTQKSKWAKALIDGQDSLFVQIWPVETHQLGQWIAQRLSQKGLSASAEAIELISARVEGNLLAAVQEIEKLALLSSSQKIDAQTVQDSVADSARYDVFGLVEAALAGHASHALRMLDGLRAEGVEALFILAMLVREIRQLVGLSQQISQGIPQDKAFASARPPIWDKRKPLVSKALNRHSLSQLNQLLTLAQQIDAQVKGQAPGNPWMHLASLVLTLAGQRLALEPQNR